MWNTSRQVRTGLDLELACSLKPGWQAVQAQRQLGGLVKGHLVLVAAAALGEGACSLVNPLVAVDLLLAGCCWRGWLRGASRDGGVSNNQVNGVLKLAGRYGGTISCSWDAGVKGGKVSNQLGGLLAVFQCVKVRVLTVRGIMGTSLGW